ncbi:hypothetical protein BRAO375_600027 [Bradyrhizobium sp. ORS 375]|nr:hypothetical protein BRAO375_600027 [Bradyrhizobium sp. ORS 375]
MVRDAPSALLTMRVYCGARRGGRAGDKQADTTSLMGQTRSGDADAIAFHAMTPSSCVSS